MKRSLLTKSQPYAAALVLRFLDESHHLVVNLLTTRALVMQKDVTTKTQTYLLHI
jgi:hypothetical protein